MKIIPVNLNQKFSLFMDHWSPKIIGRLNGQLVKVARLKGEFTRHKHDDEDELFFVIEGRLKMELDNKILEIGEGEFVIVPRGIYHKPIAEKEVKVLLFEPESTLNTGNVVNEMTVKKLKKI